MQRAAGLNDLGDSTATHLNRRQREVIGAKGQVGAGEPNHEDVMSLEQVDQLRADCERETAELLISSSSARLNPFQSGRQDGCSIEMPAPAKMRRSPRAAASRRDLISAASGREAVIGALAPGLTLGLLHALTVFFPDVLELPILLKLGDNISTDTISPAGARALPFRSNIAQIAKFSYDIVDGTYHDRAMAVHTQGGHAIVGGRNYGQGSSREHAALAPRSLGLHLVVAKGMARIHWQNLVNFGVLPLIFMDPADYDRLWQGDVIRVEGINAAIKSDPTIPVKNLTMKLTFVARHGLSDRQDRRRARGR